MVSYMFSFSESLMFEVDGLITGEIIIYVHPFRLLVDNLLFTEEVFTNIFWVKSGFNLVEYGSWLLYDCCNKLK